MTLQRWFRSYFAGSVPLAVEFILWQRSCKSDGQYEPGEAPEVSTLNWPVSGQGVLNFVESSKWNRELF